MKISCRNAHIAAALLCLLSTASVAPAQTAEQNTYARRVRNGMEQTKAGDYEAAQSSFEEAIRYRDSDTTAHLGLGMIYLHLRGPFRGAGTDEGNGDQSP